MADWNNAVYYRSTRYLLGKKVRVTVDSTYRKKLPGRGYKYINCGMANVGKGEAKRTFIIGEERPVDSFTGRIIAVAKVKDTKQEYYIVSPERTVFYEPDIEFLVGKYIDVPGKIDYICLNEKSCGAVLYTYKDGIRYYVLIKNMSGHIGFPKGHVEFGENEHKTAEREIYEETGIHTKITDGFRESYRYTINGFIHKEAIYFVASFNSETEIKMQIMEISEYMLVTFEQALKILNYPHDRTVMRKADNFISEKMLKQSQSKR